MVNREARTVAKALLESFLAGGITNDEFCKKYPSDHGDLALANVYERLWFSWDDIRKHTLSGKHQPNPEGQALFKMCIAFLGSDLEYEWPPHKWVSFSYLWINLFNALLRLFGFGMVADKHEDRILSRVQRAGDFDVWPFLRREDYARFATNPSRED